MSADSPKTIIITIKKDGKVVFETKGFTGESCREMTRSFEQALGERESEQLTGEFYQQAPQQTENQQQA